jgi:hypothetical protein
MSWLPCTGVIEASGIHIEIGDGTVEHNFWSIVKTLSKRGLANFTKLVYKEAVAA